MSSGFDINFEGLDMNPDEVQELVKKYKKIKTLGTGAYGTAYLVKG